MSGVRDEVNSLLDRLPEDASIEDVQYHLYVIEKVRNGLAVARFEGGYAALFAEKLCFSVRLPKFTRGYAAALH